MANTPTSVKVNVDARLDTMFAVQDQLQRAVLGCAPHELSDEDKMAYIREQALACMKELGEALDETGWKSWATSNHLNRDAYVSELAADAFRFLLNLMAVAGVTPAEFFDVFMAKAATVMHRATSGEYDGVTGKCPRCRRDLGDKGVGCYTQNNPNKTSRTWCDQFKGWYNTTGRAVIV